MLPLKKGTLYFQIQKLRTRSIEIMIDEGSDMMFLVQIGRSQN
jgi:hypothetical protein